MSGGDVGRRVHVGIRIRLLHGEAATERTSLGVVAAPHGADVARGGSGAFELVGHDHSHVEVLELGLREAVGTGDVVLHGQVLALHSGVALLIKITDEGARAIGIDLVEGDLDPTASLDLSHLAGGNGVLGVLANIDVAAQFSTATLVDNVRRDFLVTDNGGVQLARADGGAVTGQVLVN